MTAPADSASSLADWAGLIAAFTSLTAAVVWPLLIGFALWLFRKPLQDKIGQLRGFEGFGIKAETRELRLAAEAVIQEAGDTASAEASVSAPEPAETPAPDPYRAAGDEFADDLGARPSVDLPQSSAALHHTFSDYLSIHPGAAVLYSWQSVESIIRTVARGAGLYPRVGKPSVGQLIGELHSADTIPLSLRNLLWELGVIKNRVLQQRGNSFTVEEAVAFSESAEVAKAELIRIFETIRRNRWVKRTDS